ncbi:hypothetical protein LCGC14_3038580, partial [marine sediment metagenome]
MLNGGKRERAGNKLGNTRPKITDHWTQDDIADYFTRLIQRVMPKSWPQCAAEVTVTRVFLENFSGDSVRFLGRGFSNP